MQRCPSNPLVGEKWFVDRQEPAYKSYRSYVRAGRGAAGRFSIRNVAGDGYRK